MKSTVMYLFLQLASPVSHDTEGALEIDHFLSKEACQFRLDMMNRWDSGHYMCDGVIVNLTDYYPGE